MGAPRGQPRRAERAGRHPARPARQHRDPATLPLGVDRGQPTVPRIPLPGSGTGRHRARGPGNPPQGRARPEAPTRHTCRRMTPVRRASA